MGLVVSFVIVITVLLGLGVRAEQKKKEKALKEYDAMAKRTAEIERKNRLWQVNWNKLMSLRSEAKDLEQSKEYEKALELYLKEVELGKKYDNINYNNYSHSIKRVIILLGKLKKWDDLKEYLENCFNEYSDAPYEDREDWQKRLEKVNQKLQS